MLVKVQCNYDKPLLVKVQCNYDNSLLVKVLCVIMIIPCWSKYNVIIKICIGWKLVAAVCRRVWWRLPLPLLQTRLRDGRQWIPQVLRRLIFYKDTTMTYLKTQSSLNFKDVVDFAQQTPNLKIVIQWSLGTKSGTNIFKFKWFIDPSDQNEQYHTPLLKI